MELFYIILTLLWVEERDVLSFTTPPHTPRTLYRQMSVNAALKLEYDIIYSVAFDYNIDTYF